MKRFLSFLAILGLILTQACKPDQPSEATLSVNPKSLSFAAEGGTQTISVTAGQAWTASVSGTGFSISPSSGKGNGTVTVTAKEEDQVNIQSLPISLAQTTFPYTGAS